MPLNESPITRNALLAHSHFDGTLARCVLPRSVTPVSRYYQVQKVRKNSSMPIPAISIYHPPLPPFRRSAFASTLLPLPLPLSYSSSLLILLATRSIRKLCDRSLSCSFKRHISISPNFLHKRLGEENIRRQWVNIQSLISKIAGNRSRHCQLQRCDAS